MFLSYQIINNVAFHLSLNFVTFVLGRRIHDFTPQKDPQNMIFQAMFSSIVTQYRGRHNAGALTYHF